MPPLMKRLFPSNVVLSAILIAICLGLLFEGVTIGPEYGRYKPPFLIITVAGMIGVVLAWLFWQERNARCR